MPSATRATRRSSRRTCCRAPPPRSAPPRDRAGRIGFRGLTAKKEQGAGSRGQEFVALLLPAPCSLLPLGFPPCRFPSPVADSSSELPPPPPPPPPWATGFSSSPSPSM